jgi:hypothetical protein
MSKETASAIRDTFISPNVSDSNLEPANVVDVIAGAGNAISMAIKLLGNADAATSMGAIENLSCEVRRGSEAMATAMESLADATREVAGAISAFRKSGGAA